MVRGKGKALAESLKISRPLITAVVGCQKRDVEGQVITLPCKTGIGERDGLILITEVENFIFHPYKSGAFTKELIGNLISLQT